MKTIVTKIPANILRNLLSPFLFFCRKQTQESNFQQVGGPGKER